MMELVILAGVLVFLSLLFAGLWVPFSIGIGGLAMMLLYEGPSSLKALGFIVWGSMNSSTLSAIPLFILMAAVLLRSGVSSAFYDGLSVLVRRLPGGLIQANIAGCALFAAISGSSVATAGALGTVAIPKLREQGYDSAMSSGSLAAGGTLGILIPPSIAMIIYGSFTELSITKLFMAGLMPGIALAAMFMIYVGVRSVLQPSVVPPASPKRPSGAASLVGVGRILPLLILIVLVLGSIYFGFATPTEAAAVGAVAAFLIGFMFGNLTWQQVGEAAVDTIKMNSAILFIVFTAFIFAYGIEISGIAQAFAKWLMALNLNRYGFLSAVILLYAVLGCFIDSVGMIVLTVPLLTPALAAMGFDLIWFGVLMVVLVELGQITPPFGINLFVIDSISGRGIGEVVRGVAPYYGIIFLFVVILIVFPTLATWLPSHM
jgi:C4-dicarboxylate transporter, DctM subunit